MGELKYRHRAGFTLIEILVAFAILVLALAAVMQGLSGGLRMLSVSDAHAEALRIAENRLAEAGRAFPLRPGTKTGEDGRYRWRVDMAPHEAEDAVAAPSLPAAYAVTVTVRWGGGRSLRLSTLTFGPPADE
ncbi:MAG: prepilin-type N-terminal cleavage/methylation domain-containing protein [Alphaproteobacteria bacterium]